MATPAPLRATPLQPSDWIRIGIVQLAKEGVESVRVEVLARELGVSKGSFYWHFRDRQDLLDKMLSLWEADELSWLDTDDGTSAATRWARLVARTVDPDNLRREVALRSWAREDERVASRVAAIERKKAALIAAVLRDVGFLPPIAQEWSEVVLLVSLGWVDRATRDRAFQVARCGLGEFLSEVILAASAASSSLSR